MKVIAFILNTVKSTVAVLQRGNVYKIFVGKLEGSRPFGREISRWENTERRCGRQ
jgi:hypothetical protein